MSRKTLIAWSVGTVILALFVAWIARNTYWADTVVPMPPKGEALTNPFYAAQKFAVGLGGRATRDRVFTLPPTSAVIVLSSWHWTLSDGRRRALEQWVESGGRLVVDSLLLSGTGEFKRWSGISREVELGKEDEETDGTTRTQPENPCKQVHEEYPDGLANGADLKPRWLCDFPTIFRITTTTKPQWALSGERGIQAARVGISAGSVTIINASPFVYRELFDGDHAWLFVAATQFRRGDEIHFLSEEDHPSLLALIWQYGAPVVVLAAVLIALVLWRGVPRFGPLTAPRHSARRSLAEQILGTGQFALRHGNGEALHSASVRAFTEAVQRRVPGYLRLPQDQRTLTAARLTGFDRGALAAAIHHLAWRRGHGLRNAIALLEAARRQALSKHSRS
jgi:hypothetical protein